MINKSKQKSKVLIVNSHIPYGGLGQYTITLAENLKKNEYDIYGLVTHSNNERYNEFAANTKKTKYMGNKNKVMKYLSVIKYIWQLKPDILLINYNATAHFILPLIPKCKVISVIHSDQRDFYRIAKINYRFVDAWITPTPRVKEGFITYATDVEVTNRVHTIPHGVYSGVNPPKSLNQSTFNLVFIGMLYNHKGIDLLPEIFHRFYQDCPDSYLTVIGGGDKRHELEEQFQQRGLSEAVNMTGIVSSTEIRDYLSKMDVMLFPTRIEAFGLVIVEAMIEGVVPVTTLLPGITDSIVTDKTTGFLISKDDINGFVERLKDIYFDRQKLLIMSRNAKESALMKFTDEHMVKEYISLFSSLEEGQNGSK